ncbi:MAG: tetratricopeptide repeat protein [Flavobacteriales bacterium]|nr:tetratricopeptide repeat protein [Flavobacteriales bacterium]
MCTSLIEIRFLKILLTPICCILPFLGFCNSIDSLKQCLKETESPSQKITLNTELADSFHRLGLVDSALHYNFIAGKLAAANSDKYPYGEPSIFISRVLLYFNNHDFEAATQEAYKLFKDSISYSDRDKRELCENYSHLLIVQEKPEEAIRVLHRALDIGKKEGAELGHLYMNLGVIFYDLRNNTKARYYYNLALDYKDTNSDAIKYNIVASFIQDARFDEALELLQTIVSETDPLTHENHRFFNLLGYLYLENKMYDKSIQVLSTANKFIEQETKDAYSLMDNHVLLGHACLEKYKLTKAESLLERAEHYLNACLAGAKKASDLKSQLESYAALTEVFIYQQNLEESIMAFNNYKSVRDSLYQIEKKAIVEELDEKYQTVERQNEITFLNAEKVEKELDYQKSKNTLILIISIFILTSLFLLFLYYNSRAKKKRLLQELRIESLEKRELKSLLSLKENELTKNIGLISEKSKLIQVLKDESNKTNSNVDSIIQKFEQNYISDKEWGNIQVQFDSIYNGLIDKIQGEAGKLTQNDIKLFILLKLKYSNVSMSEILNISYEGVKKAKQRLNKKLDLEIVIRQD